MRRGRNAIVHKREFIYLFIFPRNVRFKNFGSAGPVLLSFEILAKHILTVEISKSHAKYKISQGMRINYEAGATDRKSVV